MWYMDFASSIYKNGNLETMRLAVRNAPQGNVYFHPHVTQINANYLHISWMGRVENDRDYRPDIYCAIAGFCSPIHLGCTEKINSKLVKLHTNSWNLFLLVAEKDRDINTTLQS